MGREVIKRRNKFAVRETVSDKEILTPWFKTEEELVDHLIKKGDSWGSGPLPEEVARKFVEQKFVPSMAIIDGKLYENYWLSIL